MPALDESQVDTILETDAPNIPTRVDGTPAIQSYVSPEKARQYRESVSRMLASGVSADGIIEAMGRTTVMVDGQQRPGFGLPKARVIALIAEVRQVWEAEDAEGAAHRTAAARRRHLSHIRKAEAKGSFNAVAMLEGNLIKIDGTAVPIEVKVTHEARLNDATMAALGQADEAEIRRLIEAGRSDFIDTEGTDVEKK